MLAREASTAITTASTVNAHQVTSMSWPPPSISRCTDANAMNSDTSIRNALSPSAARCSALPCPNWWSRSGGRTATWTANSVSSAATRSVPEWTASATNASEPVTRPVTSFTATRKIAAATLTSAVRRRACGVGQLVGLSVRDGAHRGPPLRRRSPRPPRSERSGLGRPLGLLRLEQPQHQRARGAAAVADRVLLLRGQLGHGPLVTGVVVRHEGGVVAEAALAARLVRQPPLAAPVHDLLAPARLHVGQRAHVRHAAVAVRRHLAEQLRQVLLIAGALPRVAGRPYPRRAAEGRRLDAGVVRHRGAARGGGRGARLAERVVGEGRAGLGRQRHVLRAAGRARTGA